MQKQLSHEHLRNYLSRIEIYFWNVSIQILGKISNIEMKRTIPLLISTIFIFVIGISLFSINSVGKYRSHATSELIQSTNQENILIVITDSFETTSPQLVGLWLLLRLQGNPVISFIPLFPDSNVVNDSVFSSIQNKFQLNQDGTLSRKFTDHLSTMDIWWTDIVLLDENTFSSIKDNVKDTTAIPSNPFDEKIETFEFSSSKDPNYIVLSQASILYDGCSTISNYTNSSFRDLSQSIDFQPNVTFIRAETFADDSKKKIQAEMICDFPTMITMKHR